MGGMLGIITIANICPGLAEGQACAVHGFLIEHTAQTRRQLLLLALVYG